ncbi:hypothetical protein FRC08_018470 [Ceratobasidium sp. 394]|nr:hypothetical protein FRC08_018470 [Ceratobasidium sp. 394]
MEEATVIAAGWLMDQDANWIQGDDGLCGTGCGSGVSNAAVSHLEAQGADGSFDQDAETKQEESGFQPP